MASSSTFGTSPSFSGGSEYFFPSSVPFPNSILGSVLSSTLGASGTVTVNATTGTTTSTANFRLEFSPTYMGVWNQAGDVIPAAKITEMKTVPSGATIVITDGTTTYTGTHTTGYAYDASDNLDWNVNPSDAPNSTWTEAAHPGMTVTASWGTYTIVTDIADLQGLYESGNYKFANVTAGNTEIVPISVTGSSFTFGANVPASTQLALIPKKSPMFIWNDPLTADGVGGSTFKTTIGYRSGGAGFYFENSSGNATYFGGNQYDADSAFSVVNDPSINPDSPQIDLVGYSANNGPEIVIRRALGTPAIPGGSLDSTNTNGRISFVYWDGAAWSYGAYISARGNGELRLGNQFGYTAIGQDNVFTSTYTGGTFGPWNTYTPTLSGTGWAVGNGTLVAYYVKIGKTVHYKIMLVFGTTTTAGSVTPTFTLPSTIISTDNSYITSESTVQAFDSSATAYYNLGARYGVSNVSPYVLGTNGLHSSVISTSPFTWAVNDVLRVSGTYEQS